MNKDLELMYSWLKEDYPEYADILIQLCVNDSEKNDLFFTHVFLAIDYFDKNNSKFSPEIIHTLLSSYSYLIAVFFCLDSLVDGHSCVDGNLATSEVAKAQTLFLTGGLIRLRKFCSLTNLDLFEVESKVNSVFYEYVLALDQEVINQQILENIDPRCDYENIIGRANLSLFMFEIVGLACEEKKSQQLLNVLKNVLKELIYFVQLSDDLQDWKQDFESSRYTSFLRGCLSKFENTPSLTELEEFIYLNGSYESWLAKIIMGLDTISKELNNMGKSDTLLMEYIRVQRKVTKEWLVRFVNEKKSFLEVAK